MNEIKPLTAEQIFKLLSDPVRLSVMQQLIDADNKEMTCGSFKHNVQKATFSHHIKLLIEAGMLQRREEGVRKYLSIHKSIFDDFPELITLITKADLSHS
ncbi:MAG: helix-turn-helix domain-containing protein [Pseudomonadota bacterium]|nr:helix-turn-helix domain-containing protein [Pseudomonadota bacterium]